MIIIHMWTVITEEVRVLRRQVTESADGKDAALEEELDIVQIVLFNQICIYWNRTT